MTAATLVQMIRREARGGGTRLIFFIACLAVGTAAVTMVAGLVGGVDAGIRSEARTLLGADVTVAGRSPIPAGVNEVIASAAQRGETIRRADVRTTSTVVAAPPADDGTPGVSRLASLRVVDGPYPFYDAITLDGAGPPSAGEPRPTLQTVLTARTAVVDPALLSILGIELGQTMRIGGETFRVVATVTEEPDRLNFSFNLAPRVYISEAGAERTPLFGFGSRVRYRALLRLPDGADTAAARELADRVRLSLGGPDVADVQSFDEAQPALREGIARMGRFLGLVGLVSLLVGGLGIAQSVRAWIAGRLDAIAIMRCLGVRPGELLLVFLLQVAGLAIAGSLVGVVAGAALQLAVPPLTGGLLPASVIDPWQPGAMLRGLGLGLVVALAFAAGPLLAIRHVPPVHVLRRIEMPRGRPIERGLAGAVIIVTIGLAAWWQTGDPLEAAIFTGGLLVATGILAVAAWAIVRVAGRLRRRVPVRATLVPLRHGLAALAAPGAATGGAVIALGIGMLLVFSVLAVQDRLRSAFIDDMPADAPSTFFVDVQPDQWEPLRDRVLELGGADPQSTPFVTARLREIDGVGVAQIVQEIDADRPGDDREKWIFTREQRLSYGDTLPADNVILQQTPAAAAAGPAAPWGDPTLNEVSVEADIAESLGVALGSVLVLDVQGVPIQVHVSSIRQVDWRSFGINFFLQVEPGVLESAPQTRVATARLPEDRAMAIQDAIVADMPNVTVVQIRAIVRRVTALLATLASAVQFLGLFTVASGLVILIGSIAAGYARRGREVAILKTIGMTRREVMFSLAAEYLLVGLIAAGIGVVGGGAIAATVVVRGLELDFPPPLVLGLIAVAAAAAGTAITGLVTARRPLRTRPVTALRGE
ncbi:MAG: ABC transporter permease [Phycisphaerales bacterium]